MREANIFAGGTGAEVFIIPNECRPFGTGTFHSADGLNFTITYDISADSYRLLIAAQNGVINAPSSAGVVTMSYTLYDYEAKDIRVGADGTIYDSAGEAVRGQFNKVSNDLSVEPRIDGDLTQIFVGDVEYEQSIKHGIISVRYKMPTDAIDTVTFASALEVDIDKIKNKVLYVQVKNITETDIAEVDILITNGSWGNESTYIRFAEAVTIKKGEVYTQEINFTDENVLSTFANVTGNVKIAVKVPDKTSGNIVWHTWYKDYDEFTTTFAFNSVNANYAREAEHAKSAQKAYVVSDVLEATNITKNMLGVYYDGSETSEVCSYKDGIFYYAETEALKEEYSAIKCLLGKKADIVDKTLYFKYTSITQIEIGLNNGTWWGTTSKVRNIGSFDIAKDKALNIVITKEILDAELNGGYFADNDDVYLIIMVRNGR
jgi:hypothetical protein